MRRISQRAWRRISRRAWRRAWTAAGITGAALLLAGAGGTPTQPGAENRAAADAVTVLTAGEAPRLPADFESVMGYAPRPAGRRGGDTVLVKDGNGCSSPFGATSFDFSVPCGEHDVGYDLLRYATAKGEPLGPWARRAVDARFDDTMHARCDVTRAGGRHAACGAMADVYAGVTTFNSWRQGYGNPGREPVGRWLAFTGIGLAGFGAFAVIRRRRDARRDRS